MTRFFFRFFLVTGSLVFCLYYSLSQKNDSVNYRLILSEYQKAQNVYDEATALSDSKTYTEEKETQLNQKALELFRSVYKKMNAHAVYDSLRFFSAFRVGELEHYFEHFSEALNGYQNAISIQLKSSLPDSLLFKPYLYSGIIFYNQNKYDTAAFYFHNAEKIQQEFNYGLEESERLYNTFGVLYYEKGDYRQAKNYFLKALEILPKTHPYYKELFLNYNINLAQIYFKLEDYDESNKIYQSLLALNPENKNEIYQNLGLINLYLGASENSLGYFRKVKYGFTNKLVWLYQNMGEAFINLDQLDSARNYLQKAIDVSNRFGNNTDHIAYGLTLKSLGELELNSGDPMQALSNYQKAVHQFYPAYTDTSTRSNPTEFSGVFSYINLFNTLVAKAEAFERLYSRSSNLSWAISELESYQSAFKLIDYVERTYNSDEARLFLDKIKYVVHVKPIDIAYELYLKTKNKKYLEQLYVFDQQNKASVLALRMQLTQQLLQKDSSIFSKERNLRSEITRLSLKASLAFDSTEISKLNKTIRDHEIELGKIQEQLTGTSVTSIPTINSLQSLLDKKTALISFHLSEDKLTTVLITSKAFECSQKTLFPGFHEYITHYIDELKNNPTSDSLPSWSKKIHSFLFSSNDLKNIERLIIIPDDELNYLSFESLMDGSGKYLVENYSVQYQYSTSLLKKDVSDLSNHETLAFAPFVHKSFSDSSLHFEALPNSSNEIKDVDGEKFVDSSATKSNFLNHLSKYKVLHLATHAVVNSKEDNLSFVSFYPADVKNKSEFLLYTEEIYNLPLNKTDLIILSACETASGNLVKGEGVMSLSRAFSYAGCSNIITSLWNANDFSTAYLTNRLHFYLDKKYSIDEALRQSKLDYLNDKSVNPRLKNPFYWSHLIFIGNYAPSNSFSYWWIVLILFIFLVFFLLFKIRKPRKKRGLSLS